MPAVRIQVPIESFDVRSKDGVRIRVHKTGKGPHRWLLTPGLGTPLLCWKHVLEAFHDRMTIVTWDQRGCYDSESPSSPEGLAFEHHVDDAFAVLGALGWKEPFVTGSWSMGVQLGLEIFSRRPEQVRALTLINGAFEHVLGTAYGSRLGAPFRRGLLRAMVRASPLLSPLARRVLESGAAGRFMGRVGVSTNNAEFVVAVTRELGRIDLGNYFTILLELDRHSGRHVLEKVEIPTLITAGEKDVAAPPALAEEMRRLIPHSQYVLIENGTHYTPLEYPEQLNRALDEFFGKVFGEEW